MHVEPILVEMFERALVGLPAACAGLDHDASQRMLTSMDAVHEALNVLAREDLSREWQERLRVLTQSSVHPFCLAACCRRMLEQEVIDAADMGVASLALSPTLPPARWRPGSTACCGAVGWCCCIRMRSGRSWIFGWPALPADVFTEMLPLVRRAFSGFSPAEERQMGDKMKRLSSASGTASHLAPIPSAGLHPVRLRLPRACAVHILGVTLDEST